MKGKTTKETLKRRDIEIGGSGYKSSFVWLSAADPLFNGSTELSKHQIMKIRKEWVLKDPSILSKILC